MAMLENGRSIFPDDDAVVPGRLRSSDCDRLDVKGEGERGDDDDEV